MGKFIIIDHGYGVTTLYGHLSAIYARENQSVRQGEIIGAIGKTGNANYKDMLPHLHLEVRKNGVHQNPQEYLE
jgi:murein DD-endopeptidase MepM/ murein hydrolase activator NlpD